MPMAVIQKREKKLPKRGWNEVLEQVRVGWDLIHKERDCP